MIKKRTVFDIKIYGNDLLVNYYNGQIEIWYAKQNWQHTFVISHGYSRAWLPIPHVTTLRKQIVCEHHEIQPRTKFAPPYLDVIIKIYTDVKITHEIKLSALKPKIIDTINTIHNIKKSDKECEIEFDWTSAHLPPGLVLIWVSQPDKEGCYFLLDLANKQDPIYINRATKDLNIRTLNNNNLFICALIIITCQFGPIGIVTLTNSERNCTTSYLKWNIATNNHTPLILEKSKIHADYHFEILKSNTDHILAYCKKAICIWDSKTGKLLQDINLEKKPILHRRANEDLVILKKNIDKYHLTCFELTIYHFGLFKQNTARDKQKMNDFNELEPEQKRQKIC